MAVALATDYQLAIKINVNYIIRSNNNIRKEGLVDDGREAVLNMEELVDKVGKAS